MPQSFPRRRVVAGMATLGLWGLAPSTPATAAGPSAKSSDLPAHPLADQLAAYADALRFEDLDTETIERVKVHLIDTLGCGIAAFDEDSVKICRDIALGASADASTIIGTNRRTTPDLATFANGVAFRYYDLNDVYVGKPASHPSDNISACIAVAEAERTSTTDLITAIVLAYEVNCRLTDAFDMTTRGWDAPNFSLPAVALAAGKLMKLPPSKLTHAVNLAINDHVTMGQTRTQTLSDWKGLSDAEAGRNAVFATMLARRGITGPAPIFEGRRGFFQLVSGPADINVQGFGRRGIPFKILQCGLKAYPAVVYGQTTIPAAIAVAKDAGDLDRITALEIFTTSRGHLQAGSGAEKWAPDNKDTADHSLPYIAARAMFDGDISNESYTQEKIKDPRIIAFMRKMTVKADPAFNPPSGSAPPTRITATLDDGRQLTHQVDKMPGFGGQPMSRADVERKFRSNVGKRWSQERTDAILQALWALDRTDDLRLLLDKLTVQAPQ